MRSNTKLISSLINRVAVRLPINSGRKLESLEQDPIVQQTVAAIIELSRYKLSTIANALGTVLENVSNNYQATSAVAIEQTIPFDILQSQLFILRLLSACMQHQWKCYRELSKERSIVAKTASLSLEAAAADAAIGIYNDSESPQITDEKSMAQSIDLPPLDEALVTFILVLMGRFLNQAHLVEEFIEQQQLNALEYPNEPLPHIEPTTANIVMDIYKAAGRVLYYVSASNWLTYYAKIKSVVQVLGAIKDLNELSPPEIRMLESSCLTRQRLQMVLSELSPYFLPMERQGKLLFSKMMRKAIWRWIETYPSQFAEVSENQSRILSGAEVLFDMCSSATDHISKKAILWPLQTILLVLSPEFLLQAFLNDPTTQNRRVRLKAKGWWLGG